MDRQSRYQGKQGGIRVTPDTLHHSTTPILHFRMIIGVPKEIKVQEYRVALLPSAAYQLVKRGHQVLVERNAGAGAGYPDADYQQAGATLVPDHSAVFEQADLVVKVKEPQPSEYSLLRPGQILFTYLHLAANRQLTD